MEEVEDEPVELQVLLLDNLLLMGKLLLVFQTNSKLQILAYSPDPEEREWYPEEVRSELCAVSFTIGSADANSR